MRRPKVYASLAVMVALLGAPAFAQHQEHEQHHSAGTPPATGMQSQGMPGGAMAGMAMMTGHVEGRLAFLKTELKITDAQLPLWNAVADAIRANGKSMSEMMSGGMMGSSQTATLPEKLALREKMMTRQLEALWKFKAAVDPLYAALSPEQKKSADELLMGPMGMGMMM